MTDLRKTCLRKPILTPAQVADIYDEWHNVKALNRLVMSHERLRAELDKLLDTMLDDTDQEECER